MTQTAPLKIAMVHDMVCSWCPIAYHNMQGAIKALKLAVEFEFLPFELNPNMPKEGLPIRDYFKHNFQWSDQKLDKYQAQLVKTAKEAGVTIDFDLRNHYYNSHHAHKLMHWVHQFGKQNQFNIALIKAYFEQGLNIGKPRVLLTLIEQLGLDQNAAKMVLTDPESTLQLKQRANEYRDFNITTIPAFILDDNHLITGSGSVVEFIQALKSNQNQNPA